MIACDERPRRGPAASRVSRSTPAASVGASIARRCASEIVDAAFRAIDQLGPELSLREIAEEAGTAKPKIYRHFTDKSDLFQAIGERLRDMLLGGHLPVHQPVDRPRARGDPAQRRANTCNLVDQHPNVCRFLIQGRFAEQSESTMRALNEGRDITLAMADMFNNELRDMELDAAAIELAAFTTFGSAALATDWWLGVEHRQPAADAAGGVHRAHDDDHARARSTAPASCSASRSIPTCPCTRACDAAKPSPEMFRSPRYRRYRVPWAP